MGKIKIIKNEDGKKLVEISEIEFSGKRHIDWDSVETYLMRFIRKQYVIDETGDLIRIGADFPDEYAHSKNREKALGTIGRAKANAAQAIPELIQIATDLRYVANKKEKHVDDAANGWYYYTVRFSLPVMSENEEIKRKNYFRGRMVVRCDAENKLYLYDIADIKKET